MRPLSRGLLALSLGCGAALGPAIAALAAGSGSITTAPMAEAWYQAAPTCVLPTGCPVGAPSPYAADTLHVGVVAGQEESRTFLQLDLTALPAGTKPVGGQLRLPVASGSRDGTRSPETAKLRACTVTEPVEDVAGEVGTGPDVDCDSASAEAVFAPASDEGPAAFTVDLTELANTWSTSAAPGALALLPEEVAPTDRWHVAFSDRTREGDGVAKITAAVSFVAAFVDVAQAPPPTVSAPVDNGFSAAPSFDSGQVFSAPPPSTFDAPTTLVPIEALPPIEAAPQAETAAPAPQAAPQQVVPVASFVDAGFRYPAVFLLPLLLAIAVGWLGRALTRDLAMHALE